jgi:hypothetical protein
VSTPDWQPQPLPPDYWQTRRPYLISNDQVWIGEPGTHHDTAPPEMRGPDSSYGDIYNDQIHPYQPEDPKHTLLVEEAWRKHPDHPGT